MTTPEANTEVVPLKTDFDVVWRGYDREQVQHYVAAVEQELRMLTMDRDAALAKADSLADRLTEAQSEIRALQEKVDRIAREPISPDALTERMRRMVELAQEEAKEITERAQAAAQQGWDTARSAEELMQRARKRAHELVTEAEQRRRELDEQAAELRRQMDEDFRIALNKRRSEAVRQIAEEKAAAKAEAERLVQEATEQSRRMVAEAERRVAELERHRAQISSMLGETMRLLDQADTMLRPQQDEVEIRDVDAADVHVPTMREEGTVEESVAAA
ncbi:MULTISPECIES: hypothetical protein [Thermocrispum]|uniref:Cell division protein DivIVA n=1 Tax=Thermocrispum agreste TaxID=37925 RepID=A0A2W4JS40_9PSEU|nr:MULTISPECIES: hypothetical protein [Thermocrispum]PZN01179.1 MAG: hypothetical protein DIU77_01505 [Thermocrispum agreste]